jgi:putative ABC transport system permease protein
MGLLTDVRYAVRRLLGAPGFTAVATITLALGIGSTTAIYSVVDALILRPLPYADPERLIDLGLLHQTGRSTRRSFNVDELQRLKTRTDLFAGVDGYVYRSGALLGSGEPTLNAGAAVTGGLMRTLGVPPQLGRLIAESDAVSAPEQVVVLSDEVWRSRFGSDPGIVGKTIRLDDRSLEVIGVMPRSFKFPDGRRQFWVPLSLSASPETPPIGVIARTRSDQTVAEAGTRIAAATLDISAEQGAPATARLQILPSMARHLNAPVRTTIYVLAGAVVFVLLIACANIANLLLVQHAGREREVAVRAALGASRRRLLRQFLTEAVLLTCLGGALGLLAAGWTIDLLVSMVPSEMTFLSVNDISLDRRTVLFAVGLTAVTGVLFGLLPALRGTGLVLFESLKSGARTATPAARQERMRRGFVIVQLAVAVVLLVGASLLTRTFIRLTQVDPGFDGRNLATMTLELPRWKYPSGQARREFYDNLLDRVRALPGVAAATVGGTAPPENGNIRFGLTFDVEGQGVVLNDPALVVPFGSVAGDYFSVLGIPIKAGEMFAREGGAAPDAIIISEQMAIRLWKGENPIGKRLRMGTQPSDRWHTVTGVAGDVYQFDYAQTRGQFAYYLPANRTSAPPVQNLIVRTSGEPSAILQLLREQVRAIDPEQPIWKIGTMETKYGEFFALPRFYTFLMTTFALVGLAIAAVGLYGVLAYAIAQRTREFGIRLALGASGADVLWLVLRNGAILTLTGIVVGAVSSLIVSRSLATLLVDVPRADPVTYGLVTTLLTAIALTACWIPARRATRVDPVVALRAE